MLTHRVPFGLPEPRVVVDREGRILNWNEGVEQLLGERSPLQGRLLSDFLSGGDAAALAAWLTGLHAHEGRSVNPQTLTLRGPDGYARRVELVGQTMSGRDRFCLLVQPLPEPSGCVLATLEHHPAPMAVLQLLDPMDLESLVLLGFNAAARAAAGVDLAPLTGRRLDQAVPLAREQGWLDRCVDVARGGSTQELDLRVLLPRSPHSSARLTLWSLPEHCVGVSLHQDAVALPRRTRALRRLVERALTAVTP